ncbi:NAD(P)/FAD-dependent oxidoreductase [Actinokineospora globicatena]|uniref:NAD(P)/FAD-dependent oxidoreductase n=1 Tax=Actinokineospora globicatena TaxID=103729 RepID=UPI00336F0083|nr:pyridine nucleotide-disulfide oxidoreductase [Actinokineospora globicatena]GLW86135.1 pyridine nucleotide-disulfide oxidoreductase [Actinokineospora globicatena]
MTVSQQGFVIVGAGMAGAKAAEGLRGSGFDGTITVLGDEAHRPYERPPLSKDLLLGKGERDDIFVHAEEWYREHDVDLQLGTEVTAIDRGGRLVEIAGGGVRYDKLLLTTGARPRTLHIPGATADGVLYLRQLADSERVKETLDRVSRLVVIGSGWIGLEVAAAARQADVAVTVLGTSELPLLRALGPELGAIFADLHRSHDVDLRGGVSVSEITTADGKVTGVRLADGTEIAAEAVLVAVGAEPNTRLAEQAGLRVDNGIVVDAGLRTDDPNVFAAGDVASAFHPLLGKHIRVEHWANALNQPTVAAANMLGNQTEYDELPYFFTDQYDLGMEYHGYVDPGRPHEVVFRGDVAAREFIAFWLADGKVNAAINVNTWDVGDPIKSLIRSTGPIDPAVLADPDHPLDSLA